eukprot:662013-Pelagomonas_calceolata.AAC.2
MTAAVSAHPPSGLQVFSKSAIKAPSGLQRVSFDSSCKRPPSFRPSGLQQVSYKSTFRPSASQLQNQL